MFWTRRKRKQATATGSRKARFPSLSFSLKKSPPAKIAASGRSAAAQQPVPQKHRTLEARRKGNKAPLSPPLTILTSRTAVPETTPTRGGKGKRPIDRITASLDGFTLDGTQHTATMGGCQSATDATRGSNSGPRPASIHVRRSGSDNLAPIDVDASPCTPGLDTIGGRENANGGPGKGRDAAGAARAAPPAEKKRRSLKDMTQAAVSFANTLTGGGDKRPPGVRDAERHAAEQAKAADTGGKRGTAAGRAQAKKSRKRPRAKLEDYYNIERELGRGHYAIVYRAVDRRTGKRVAVKRIAKKRSSTKKLVNEVKAMQKAGGHQNVVGLYDIFESDDRLDLVMQYVTGGELFDRLIAKGAYSEKVARHHIRRICEALRFLHSLNITHRDLKPENLLLTSKDEDADVVIADFGLSRITESHRDAMTTVCGTWAYCAPEVKDPSRQKDFGYTHKVDLWSLGVIMYVILCGYHPFDPHGDSKDAEIVRRVLRAEYDFDDAAWGNVSRDAQDMITHLLVVDAGKRYDTNDVLRHPWMLRGISRGLADLPDQPISPKIHSDLKALQEKMAWK